MHISYDPSVSKTSEKISTPCCEKCRIFCSMLTSYETLMIADRIEDCRNTLNGLFDCFQCMIMIRNKRVTVHDCFDGSAEFFSKCFFFVLTSDDAMTAESSETPRISERTSSKVRTVHEFCSWLEPRSVLRFESSGVLAKTQSTRHHSGGLYRVISFNTSDMHAH